MPNQQPAPAVQNHFQAGLKTEFTGLNFPENAATSTSNCIYTLIGDVTRRGGINYETNFVTKSINTASVAQSSYKWTNVGGDGQTKILVKQIGATLYFYQQTNATTASPLSTTLLSSNVSVAAFQVLGNTNNVALTECQYADGNGFLIVFHKDCDPFFCSFNPAGGLITPTKITINIRDFAGIPEAIANNARPNTLSQEHQYNLQNQGWTAGTPWTATIYNASGGPPNYPSGNPPFNDYAFPTGTYHLGDSITIPILSQTNTTSVTNGSQIQITDLDVVQDPNFVFSFTISVTNYTAPFTSVTGVIVGITGAMTLPFTVSYTSFSGFGNPNNVVRFVDATQHRDTRYMTAALINVGFINTWLTQVGNYPSNSDIWWLYKDTTNTFKPSTTISNVQQSFGASPKGYYVLNAWNQDRASATGLGNLTAVNTVLRPSTGCWYQGRVFYTGVNASQQPIGDEPFVTWTENIYFSQIVVNTTDFGTCYQQNDPTNQNFFSILPSDGGVITIQGCGAIYKLFPLRFGLLVFAANGVWFIGGSQGVGFSADDFTITKISTVQTISNTSFIDVLGFPYFWNAEGIYKVAPSQQPGSAHSPDIQLDVQNVCLGTILTFYNQIPLLSAQYSRGDYNSIDYIVQWVFRSTQESGISNRYTYDSVLCLNTVTNAFYPYSLPTNSNSSLCDIKFIQNPGGTNSPAPTFKYITLNGTGLTFSEENDFTRLVDFFSENSAGFNFTSTFTAGYNLPGQGTRKMQVPYLYLFFREPANSACQVQGVWDYSISRSSGRWSAVQLITNNVNPANFNMLYRRVRLRGRGMAFQLKIISVQGQPFDLMGWSVWNVINPGV